MHPVAHEIAIHGGISEIPGWQLKQSKRKDPKARCKLHLLFNLDSKTIEEFKVTGVRRHDFPVSIEMHFRRGKLYVFDRAYNGIMLWGKIIKAGSHFVSRIKKSKSSTIFLNKVVKDCPDKFGVLFDGPYVVGCNFIHFDFENLEILPLRQIVYRDRETQKLLHFVTSDSKLRGVTIAQIYKRRWGVELLNRWLKGHLRIRYLSVKNTNAVKTQLSVAVLSHLLLSLQLILEKKHEGQSEKFGITDLLRRIQTDGTRQIVSQSQFPDDCRWNSATRANT
jgi:hypothetical protein